MAIFQLKLIFFEKFQKLYLDRNIGNNMCSFQCCSYRDKPVNQYGRQTAIAKNLDIFWQKRFVEFFSFTRLFICKKNFEAISISFLTITLQSY